MRVHNKKNQLRDDLGWVGDDLSPGIEEMP
jgi:hypothetical protein